VGEVGSDRVALLPAGFAIIVHAYVMGSPSLSQLFVPSSSTVLPSLIRARIGYWGAIWPTILTNPGKIILTAGEDVRRIYKAIAVRIRTGVVAPVVSTHRRRLAEYTAGCLINIGLYAIVNEVVVDLVVNGAKITSSNAHSILGVVRKGILYEDVGGGGIVYLKAGVIVRESVACEDIVASPIHEPYTITVQWIYVVIRCDIACQRVVTGTEKLDPIAVPVGNVAGERVVDGLLKNDPVWAIRSHVAT